jgi:hypothetical protein
VEVLAMKRRPILPEFRSGDEARAYFERYGRLEFYGRAGLDYEYCVYSYHVRDGRTLALDIYDDGRVKLRQEG